MNLPLFLARRFLSSRRGALLGTVSRLALFGVAVGTAALVVAMALMSGYRGELSEKLSGANAEVLALPGPEADAADVKRRLAPVPGVTAVAETAFAPGLVLSAKVPSGLDVLVKALDVPAGLSTTRLLGRVGREAIERLAAAPAADGPSPVLLGSALATRLGVGAGETVVLETASPALASGVAPPRRTPLLVAALLETGFSEVDDGWIVAPLTSFPRFAPPDARVGVFEMKLERPGDSDRVVEGAREALGPAATVFDWKTMNRDLFQTLLVQQVLLFVALALIVAVAAGTVVSAVVVLVTAKTRDAGLLAALGGPPKLLVRTFRTAGLVLGASGIGLGVAFGLAVSWALTTFRVVRFPSEIAKVYYIGWMPFRPEPLHVAAVVGVGLLLVFFASLLPARRAARLAPAEALRYE